LPKCNRVPTLDVAWDVESQQSSKARDHRQADGGD
jgi:hypothetical protein